MSTADYYLCAHCGKKALYDSSQDSGYDSRADIVVLHPACLELIVADTRRKVAEELLPVLVAHQRHRGGCLCGWNELGRSHPAHIIAVWQDVARGSGGDEMATHDTPISEETK